MLFSRLPAADQCFWGLIWFLKAPRPPKTPFHWTLVIWNIFFFPSFELGLWLKTKGRLSQRARLLPPALRNCSQQITVNMRTKASSYCTLQVSWLQNIRPRRCKQSAVMHVGTTNGADPCLRSVLESLFFFFFSFALFPRFTADIIQLQMAKPLINS